MAGASVNESARRRSDSCRESEYDLVPLCCSITLDNESLLSGLCTVGEVVRESWNRDLEYKLSDLFGKFCACCAGFRVAAGGVGLPFSDSWLTCGRGEDLTDSEGG